MKPTSFVPTVGEISAEVVGEIPGLDAVISHWTGGACSAEEWFRELNAGWGTSGFVVRRGDDALGFVVYGPGERLPRASAYPVGPLARTPCCWHTSRGTRARVVGCWFGCSGISSTGA